MDERTNSEQGRFHQRVVSAAEAALKAHGAVGPLELFMNMGLLQWRHFEQWRKGNEHFPDLERWIQVGPAKLESTLRIFHQWVQRRGLKPVEASYARRGLSGIEELKVTADGDPEREKFYRTHYAPELSEKKAQKLKEKLSKAPDLVVFQKVSDEGACSECGAELFKGSLVFMEKDQPLCLACADLDHLVFLPSGDAALSRRARKHSQLSAVVVRFSRPRKRYERQGLLVTSDALARAEAECEADAPERAARRAVAAVERVAEDAEFVGEMTNAILVQFPGCPPDEARQIATHAGERGSGRVGRSAAGRAFDTRAIELAVRAHIRHGHTNYDALLMRGVARLDAREQIRDRIEEVVHGWSGVKP